MAKIAVVLFFTLTNLVSSSLGASLFPCYFIFGDSLVDSGNNNALNTTAKANYLPYGVDLDLGPTGRFTNGLTTADILGEMLGFDALIPPFATAKGRDIIKGVNYASGTAGIRNETGQHIGERISLDHQLINHNITISRFAHLYGNATAAKRRLKQCLYLFVVGSNDYINNYYQPQYYPTSKLYTVDQYATVLTQQYSQQLKKLYHVGARKISVYALGPLGCAPGVVAAGTNGRPCVDSINDAVRLFNDRLQLLVNDLNDELTDAKFVYVGAADLRPTEVFAPVIRVLGLPCCNVSTTTGLCIAGETPCPVRDLHFFYDSFHPSEIVNRIVAAASYVDILKLI